MRVLAEKELASLQEQFGHLQEQYHTLNEQHRQVQEANRTTYDNLHQQLKHKDDILTAANHHIEELETEKEALKRYEAQYLASSEAIVKASVAREIHVTWLEGERRALKEHAARLYQEKMQAEALVARAQRQGFLVVPGNAPATE